MAAAAVEVTFPAPPQLIAFSSNLPGSGDFAQISSNLFSSPEDHAIGIEDELKTKF